MNTTQTSNCAEFDFSSKAPSLLNQLDFMVSTADMARAANKASRLLTWATDQSAAEQAELVSSMSIVALSNSNLKSSDSLAVAVGIAALVMVAQTRRTTASERIQLALTLLSERYQADW